MASLSHVVVLNNEGVGLLLQHDHQGAAGIFLNALRVIKHMLGTQGEKITFDSQISPDLIHEANHSIQGFQDPSCFVFARAITLSPRIASSSSSISEGVLNEISAVILLNIALVYHHAGQVDRSFLNKAQSMYEKVIQIAGSNKGRQGTTSLLVQAAAINNLSHILQACGDYSGSLEGFKYLGSLLASVGAAVRQQMCEQEVYHGMLLNALLVNAPNTAAAA